MKIRPLLPSKTITGVAAAMLFFCTATLHAQITFVPPSYNYSGNQYNAGNQNWHIAQDNDGVVYIANNDGLLAFDGSNWTLHEMPHKRGVKSILADSDSGKIYVGSFEEFGYFEKNSTNQLTYHSLTPLLENYHFLNDEIWTIQKIGDEIFFQSFSSYFTYHTTRKQVAPFNPHPGPLFFFTAGNNLYAQFIDDAFARYSGKEFTPLLTREELHNDVVVGVLPHGSNLLLFLSKKGILEYDIARKTVSNWETEIDNILKNNTINRTLTVSDSIYVIGTLENGIFALHADGSLKWHLNKSNGLNNNTVLGLFADRDKNIWCALDNGISYVQTNSSVSFYEPSNIQIGLVEDMLVHGNAFYLATNQGVYKHSDGHIRPLPQFEIQSWFIKKFGNQIVVGHNNGTSFIENDRNIPVFESNTGGMDIKNMRLNDRDILLESTYTALQLYTQTGGQWQFEHKIGGFFDLINRVEVDHTGNIWAGHMYKGMYRLRTNPANSEIIEKQYYSTLDSAIRHQTPLRIMKLRGRMIFTDHHRFYTYNDIDGKIVPFDQLNAELPDLAYTNRIVAINDTSFWFVRDNEYTLVDYAEGRYAIREKIPFSVLNNPPNKGRGNVYVDENGTTFLCLNGGIGKYTPTSKTDVAWQELSIAGIVNFSRKKDDAQHLPITEKNIIPYSDNNLTFQFRYPRFSKTNINIECYLEGYDTRWMAAENAHLTATYTNLPAGNYVLKARATDDYGRELSSLSHPFQIKNPWYKTAWAYTLYMLLLLSITLYAIHIYTQRIIKKKNRFYTLQEKERLAQLEKQERIITKLKNEKLQAELVYKSKELATASMNIINQKEFLNTLKKEIQQNILQGKIHKTEGRKLTALIDGNLSEEDEWTVFKENFDLIHENFFRKLQSVYPQLTPVDLKLCALLRLNYSSKEIAKMLNLTIRGVEAARYRLRKKLHLTEDENLVSFMIEFK